MIIIGQSRLLEDGLVLTFSLSTYRYEQSCSQNPNVTAKCRGIVSTFLYLDKYVTVGIPKSKIWCVLLSLCLWRARADISVDVTAELQTVRRKSREREQECIKLKEEIQVWTYDHCEEPLKPSCLNLIEFSYSSVSVYCLRMRALKSLRNCGQGVHPYGKL